MSFLIIFGAKYLYLVIVIVALWYIVRQPQELRRRMVLCALIALPLTYIIAKIGSMMYYDPRPFVVENFVPLLAHAADNGFPSDHTLFGSAIASVIFLFHRKYGALLFAVALLVGLARVGAGIHHFVDIFGSMLIAFVVTFVVFTFILPIVWKKYGAEKLSS